MEQPDKGEGKPRIRFACRPMTASDEDLQRFRGCFGRNGSPRIEAWVRWQYVSNPTGEIFVDFAIDPARPADIAGIYAVQPARCPKSFSLSSSLSERGDSLARPRCRSRTVGVGI
jgi:hypothetical protein